MSWWRPVLAAAAGLGAASAAAPLEWRWMAPLAVAGLVSAVRAARLRTGAAVGLIFGLTYVLALASWMRVIGTDAWLLIGFAAAGYYAVAGAGIAVVARLRCWPLWVAAWWVTVETVMAAWPLGGFPWTRLAWTTIDTPLSRWLPWIGASGASFVVALLGALLVTLSASLLGMRSRSAASRGLEGRQLLLTGLGLVGLVGFPVVVAAPSLASSWESGQPAVRVAAVQGDVPGAGNDVVAVHRQVTANHVTATTRLAQQVRDGDLPRPDFVLWPENSTAVDPFSDAATRSGINQATRAIGVPTLVGAIVDGRRADEVLNQGLVWNTDGTVSERYTKRHPVPFGEYIPFRKQLAGLKIGRLDMVPRDMTPGTRTRPLEIAGALVADLVCFDVAFDDSVTAQVRRGAQLVTVQTSNASFIGTAQLEQQFAISRLRALETGRTVVVASTNGISGVIAPDGSVVTRLRPRTTDVAMATVPLIDRQTAAVRLGPALTWMICLLGVGAAAAGAGRTRRRTAGPLHTEREQLAEVSEAAAAADGNR
ncbi:apolipoprotein N-acyltransferase [Pimelobacter simplex]|uniref:apolipoprotein N-acyltransferase n=2 Tax=Nocardioides simplex TaxID=2045 RepID=UPI00215011B5|nr:apolipoprotein N-acyltransferase [Pimelobacter simplex]